jgi:hypothetical protein
MEDKEGGGGEEEENNEDSCRADAAAGINIFQRMRLMTRQPDASRTCPKSWVALVDEWEALFLASFLNSNQKAWMDNTIRMRFNKRNSAIKEIIHLRGTQTDISLVDVAVQLEGDRLDAGVSLTEHLTYL